MTYQQAIADAIKLFLTMDVATTAVTGSGLFSFCHAAVDAAITTAASADVATTMITAAAITGSGSFFSSSVVDAVTTTAAANPILTSPMGSSNLNPLVLSSIYPLSAA